MSNMRLKLLKKELAQMAADFEDKTQAIRDEIAQLEMSEWQAKHGLKPGDELIVTESYRYQQHRRNPQWSDKELDEKCPFGSVVYFDIPDPSNQEIAWVCTTPIGGWHIPTPIEVIKEMRQAWLSSHSNN